jgi:pimeloyl-ACP methyl ester carboxylesterase
MALLAFAARHPDVAATHLRGIVLVSTAARLGLAHVPMLDRAFLPFASGFVRSGAWARSDWSRLMARLAFGRDPAASQVELVRVLLASAPEATVAAAARALATFDCTEHLGRVGLPVLVVNGTADLCVTPGDARRLARGLPDARLELVAGAGHMLMLERADRLADLLRAFARDVGIAADVAA